MVRGGGKAQGPRLEPRGRRASQRKNPDRKRARRRPEGYGSGGQGYGQQKDNMQGEAWAGADRAEGQPRGGVRDAQGTVRAAAQGRKLSPGESVKSRRAGGETLYKRYGDCGNKRKRGLEAEHGGGQLESAAVKRE